MKKVLVMYHSSCPDGFASAYIAWKTYGDNADYKYIQYNKINTVEDFENMFGNIKDRYVYLLDFSFPIEVMEHLCKNANRFVWLDHHKDSAECYLILSRKYPNQSLLHSFNTESGAMMTCKHFGYSIIPDFVKYVDDYDRWIFKYGDETRAFNKMIWRDYPFTFTNWKEYERSEVMQGMVEKGVLLVEAHDAHVNNILNGATLECNIHGYKGLIANASPMFSSDLGNKMAVKCGTYGIVWYQNKDKRVLCSVRSASEDYDTTKVSNLFGGGGHVKASGFSTDLKTLESWIV